MKKLKFFIVIVIVVISFNTYSQSYTNAIGLRFGFPTWVGVDFKHNFDAHWGIDVGAGFADHFFDVDVQGLYHFPISGVTGLRWYLGVAVDAGVTFFPNHYYGPYHGSYYYDNQSRFILGISVLGGVEYSFSNIPLNLSLDLGPRLPISPWGGDYYGSWFGRGNVAVRYTF